MTKPVNQGTFPTPTESEEQRALFEWRDIQKAAFPDLALMYHIANEGKRSPRTGARMRAEGLSKGLPDIHLPVARGGSHSLYIELKSTRKGARLTPEQIDWMDRLKGADNEVAVCYGADAAIQVIMRYLTGKEMT